MSWSINVSGTKAAVRKYVEAAGPRLNQQYAVGTPEGDDIVACVGRILAQVDALDVSGAFPGAAHGVNVEAGGSNYSGSEFRCKVGHCALALDAP